MLYDIHNIILTFSGKNIYSNRQTDLKRKYDFVTKHEVGEEAKRQVPTSEGAFAQALFDSVGPTHMEGFGDFLVHEALTVQHVGHHHAQIKDLQKLSNGGHLHQVTPAFI